MHHKHLLPNIFSSYFVPNYDIHAHNTRSKNLIHVRQYNKNLGQRNFNFLGGTLWNTISENLREINSGYLFRNKVKEYLLGLI